MPRLTTTLILALVISVLPCTGTSWAAGSHSMHLEKTSTGYTLSFTTKYTFHDNVAYSSPYNGSGSGRIVSIDIDSDGVVRYTIAKPDDTWQPGILEEEITQLKAEQ